MKVFYCLLIIVAPLLLIGQSTLLTENFTNGIINNTWYSSFPNGTVMDAAQIANTPSGDGWGGRIPNDGDGGVGAVLSGPGNFTDFYYESNIFVPLDQATYYGIEFRLDSTGSSEGYNFIIRPKGGMLTPRIRFRYRVGASPTTIRDWINDVPGGMPTVAGWHKLGVSCKADSFWLYYDNQLLPGCPIIDNSASTGFIGFYYWDQMVVDSVMMVDDLVVTDHTGPVSIEKRDEYLPKTVHLKQNYPNPFNPNTTIKFNLDKADNVKLVVYNSTGELIKKLADNQYSTGTHQIKWDATDISGNKVSAGVYLYSLQTANGIETKKMILLK